MNNKARIPVFLSCASVEIQLSVIAHYALGLTAYNLGDLLAARGHLEEGRVCYTSAQRRSPLFQVGQDPGVACLVFAAYTLWSLGYPDQALGRAQEALALTTQLAHPFSSTFVLNESWEIMERTDERLWQAEMCRLKGKLLLARKSQKPVLSEAEGANVKSGRG